MRILLASTGSGSRGGGEIFLDYLGKGLADRGHDVLMWVPNHTRMDELAQRCSRFARILRSDYRNTYDYLGRSLSSCFNWNVSRRIAREWKDLRPDVIHINKQNLEDGLDLLRAARLSALPTVCTIHLTQTADYLSARVAFLRDWIARWQLSRYKGTFVAVQDRRCAALREFLAGHGRTKTIFNGVPVVDPVQSRSIREAKRKELGIMDGEFLVLGVGRLVQQKRPLQFLRLAKELYSRFPNMRFLWVGDGDLTKQWQNKIRQEQLDTIVSCAGWQTDVTPFLLASDLLLHVAQFEGLPLVVIEAMAAQLACAITRDLASEVPLFNESNVIFADDTEQLGKRLESRLSLMRIAQNGRRLFEDRFSVNIMAQSYEELYLNVARERLFEVQ
jgi:glycosyltransferase involved in cell wall biosynthesis